MFGKQQVASMISRSAENESDRRKFLRTAGLTGLGVVGAAALAGGTALPATAATGDGVSDGAILNFALNLEYLEAEFYHYAAYGTGIPEKLTHGKGDRGPVVGGSQVPFKSAKIRSIAEEIASDEKEHVAFLRAALGGAKVSRPKIDLKASFTAAALAAGLIQKGQTFDPFADEVSFLAGAFLFEDVGVTAYKGAAPLITNKTYLGAAAGILAVEAYHAGIVRAELFNAGGASTVKAISDARDSLDGKSNLDQGLGSNKNRTLVPVDKNGIAFGRTPGQVLNIVYLNPKKVTEGGFFPKGVNGSINTSAKH